MPMIGNQATQGRFIELDSLSASATANYTLQLNSANYSPESVNNLLVSINGVIQGSSTMSLNGAVLTVGATLSNSDTIDFVRVFGNVGTVSTPTDGSVTANKIGTGAVTSAKIADGTIVNADINASAGIAGSKLGTVAATVASDGVVYIKDHVLKVYQHTSHATATNGSTTYKSTGLFLTITPQSSSSKFLVSFNGYGTNGSNNLFAIANVVLNPSSSTNINTVLSGGTLLDSGDKGMAMNQQNSGQLVTSLVASLLHSPSTASEITYNVVLKQSGGGSAYWGGYDILTTLTIMEIGG